MNTPRRVAVTGLGVVAPGGVTREAFWTALTEGRTATHRITMFDPSPFRSRVAAECDFDACAAGLSPREIRRSDRYIQFALAAAAEAVADSGIVLVEMDGETDADAVCDADAVGVVLGTAVGGTTALETEYVVASDSGGEWLVDPDHATPFLYQALIPSSLAADVATRFGTRGPAQVVSTGCTSGIDAIGYAYQLVADGEADVVITGAADSPISPITLASFDAIKATSPDDSDPAHASRPFDRDRLGFILGEGAAVLILEEYGRALRRGAHVYLVGCDGAHSVVRKGAGFRFDPGAGRFPQLFMLADLDVDWSFPPGYLLRFINEADGKSQVMLVCVPLRGEGRYRG